MGAAVLMGILTSSLGADGAVISAKTMELPADAIPSVVRCLANIVAGIMPASLGQHLPLVIGILSVPLALAFDTDSYFYGMLPVVIGIGQAFGVESLSLWLSAVTALPSSAPWFLLPCSVQVSRRSISRTTSRQASCMYGHSPSSACLSQ